MVRRLRRGRPALALAALGSLLLPGHLAAQRRLNYFVEAAGSGGFASVNLELRTVAAFRLRAGGGLLLLAPTIPLTGTFSIGRGYSSLEVGGGATLAFFPDSTRKSGILVDEIFDALTTGAGLGTVVLPSGVIGYRYEKPDGFLFRATLTPFFPDGHLLVWAGISLGGAF